MFTENPSTSKHIITKNIYNYEINQSHSSKYETDQVLIFPKKKAEVDDIHQYLLLKGVEAVSIHSGEDQEERRWAVCEFKEGQKDVLIAIDIASKGLDFENIEHVINYDMPGDIENSGMRSVLVCLLVLCHCVYVCMHVCVHVRVPIKYII